MAVYYLYQEFCDTCQKACLPHELGHIHAGEFDDDQRFCDGCVKHIMGTFESIRCFCCGTEIVENGLWWTKTQEDPSFFVCQECANDPAMNEMEPLITEPTNVYDTCELTESASGSD